uniref:SAM domain-containing protein n=1 Tax=Anopheles dirus TaxID=7168 RepID=A0A182N7F3_9DIPT
MIGSGITVHPIGNVNTMSYQPTKIAPQMTTVSQTAAGSNASVVLPTGTTGTICDLRRVAATAATAAAAPVPPAPSTGMKVYRAIAPKPSTVTIAPTTIPPTMMLGATTNNPMVALCPTVSMTSLTGLSSSANPAGNIPIAGSLIVQPIVTTQQHQQHQQPSLYAASSGQLHNLVLPLGTTIKVTPTMPDQYIQHSVPMVLAKQQQQPPQQQQLQQQQLQPQQHQIHNISLTPQPAAQAAGNKVLLTATTTTVRPTITARRSSVVGTHLPPLYVPPNKAGVITPTIIKSPVSVTAPATSTPIAAPKVVVDASRIVSAAGGPIHAASLDGRPMSVGGVIKPNPAVCDQQALPIPKLTPFTAPKLPQQQQQQQQHSVQLPTKIPIQQRRFIPMPTNVPVCVVQHGKVTVLPQEQEQPPPREEDPSSDADGSLVMDLEESNTQEESEEKKSQDDPEPAVVMEAQGSPKRPSSGTLSAGTNISPRLQKRSASEHQRPVSDTVNPTPPVVRRAIPMRRRFSEYPTVRPPLAGVTIPFTDEHYYIPLGGAKHVVHRNEPAEAPSVALQANSNMSLLCTEKLETVKVVEQQESNSSRPSVVKLAKPPTFDHFMDSLKSELEKDLKPVVAEGETACKKPRLLVKEERADANEAPVADSVGGTPRSTSTSSDSNMAVGKFGARRSGGSGQSEQSARKQKAAGGAGARKNASARSPQVGAASLVTPSESSASLQDDGSTVCDTSTVADLLRWYDGIGFLAEGQLHFEFNKFGMVQPLTVDQYERHCVTDVYRNMQLPIEQRSAAVRKTYKQKRPTADDGNDGQSYRCGSCYGQGTAAEFVTPDHCSIQCVKASRNQTLLKYIHNSTHALQNGASQLLGMKATQSKSAKGGPKTKANEQEEEKPDDGETQQLAMVTTSKKRAAVKRQRKMAPKSSTATTTTTSDDDSMSSLSLNSSTFLKRQQFQAFLPSSLDADSSATVTETADGAAGEEPSFSWPPYLKQLNVEAAPAHLFGRQPYPAAANTFRVGMKLEAIDPENCSLFCVCTVAEVRGYRMRLHFDGYPCEYDFWVNADSCDIFPPGWCQKTSRALQPPASYVGAGSDRPFHWRRYLQESRAPVPESEWFTHLEIKHYMEMCKYNRFEVGMALEADDLKKSGKVCVASVADKFADRILVHFDGWDERYDYWVSIFSNYIHPVNWHKENNDKITAPPDWNKPFDWAKYLRYRSRAENRTIVQAGKSLFRTRPPIAFKPGQRLEVVDRKQKKLVRPATVVAIDGYELKLCFDGWPRSFAFWIEDDSPDLHPVNWCERTKHPLEPPPSHQLESGTYDGKCELKFCLSRGNTKAPNKKFHDRSMDCPYRRSNWLSEDRKPLRISHDQVEKQIAVDILDEFSEDKKLSTSNSVQYIAKSILMEVSARNPASASSTLTPKLGKGTLSSLRRASIAGTVPPPMESSEAVKRIKREAADEPRATTTSCGSSSITTATSSSSSSATAATRDDPPKDRIVRLTKESEPAGGGAASPPPPPPPPPAVRESIRIALPVLDEYGPQLLHSYETWRQHSRYLDECTERSGLLRKNPLHWTTDEMARYIEQLPRCGEYANRIRHEEITGRSFLSFTQADLINYLGVKIGPAVKIYNRIIRLRQLVTTKFIQL